MSDNRPRPEIEWQKLNTAKKQALQGQQFFSELTKLIDCLPEGEVKTHCEGIFPLATVIMFKLNDRLVQAIKEYKEYKDGNQSH